MCSMEKSAKGNFEDANESFGGDEGELRRA